MHPIPRHINYNSNNVFKSIRKTVRSASHTNCRRIFDGSLHLVQHTEGNQSLNANNVYRCGSCHLCIIIILFFPIPCANDFSDHHHFEHTTFSFLHSIVISIWNNCHLVAIQSIKSECMITLYASLCIPFHLIRMPSTTINWFRSQHHNSCLVQTKTDVAFVSISPSSFAVLKIGIDSQSKTERRQSKSRSRRAHHND